MQSLATQQQKMVRRMCNFYKLITPQKLLYVFNSIPPKCNRLRHPNIYSVMSCRNNYCENLFITYVVREWSKLGTEICNSSPYQQIRKSLLSFINQPVLQDFLFISLMVLNCLSNWDLVLAICVNIISGIIFVIP